MKLDTDTAWTTEIEQTIARSISHTEIAHMECEDPAQAVSYIQEQYDDVGHVRTNDGPLDVWGSRDGEDFRIQIAKA